MTQCGSEDNSVGARVRRLRQQAKLTQHQLAGLAGVCRQTIMVQERNPDRCSRRIDEIARALDVSGSYLRYGALAPGQEQGYTPDPSQRPQLRWVPVYSPERGYEALRTSYASIAPESVIATPRSTPLVGVKVSGTGIQDIDNGGHGALVLFTPVAETQTPGQTPGALVVISDHETGSLLVRRAKHRTPRGDLEFVPDDPMHAKLVDGDQARLAGVIVEVRLPQPRAQNLVAQTASHVP